MSNISKRPNCEEKTIKNSLLTNFLHAVKEASVHNEPTFEIKHLMTNTQRRVFDNLEDVVADLFSAECLYTGVEKTIQNKELTSIEQVSVLVFLKIFETFIETTRHLHDKNNKANTETNSSSDNNEVIETYSPLNDNGVGADGMYI